MDSYNVALYGCGTVGMGVARTLLRPGPLHDRLSRPVRLRYVVDLRTEDIRRELQPPEDVILTDDLERPLQDPEVDAVVELVGGTTHARRAIEQALQSGRDVATANKALLAECGDELYALARDNDASIAFEASVGGGIPVIAALRNALVADRVESVYGIVNGTCNYVLTRMLDRGIAYEDALAEAQAKGYAEADPALDVEGTDSAHKLAVLARLAFGVRVDLADIPCEGIAEVELADLEYARALGYTLKLLAIGVRRDGALELRVHPALLHAAHPLSAVSGVYNAVCIHGDRAGEIVLTGKGAGRMPTGSAVVADIARMALGTYQVDFAELAQFGPVPDATLVPFGDTETRYYLRLNCLDQPGVLAHVAGILAEEGISIASVRQHEVAARKQDFVPVVFMTHQAREADLRKALRAINRLDVIQGARTRMLRVEDV